LKIFQRALLGVAIALIAGGIWLNGRSCFFCTKEVPQALGTNEFTVPSVALMQNPAKASTNHPNTSYNSKLLKELYAVILAGIHQRAPASTLAAELKKLGLHLGEVHAGSQETGLHEELRTVGPEHGIQSLSILLQSQVAGDLEITRMELFIQPNASAYSEVVESFEAVLGPGNHGVSESNKYRSWGIGNQELWIDQFDETSTLQNYPVGTVAITFESVDDEDTTLAPSAAQDAKI
jgi:hypothetical protein